MGNILWVCPQCKTVQDPDEVRTIEILEPGKTGRIEYHGKIRPTSGFSEGIRYSCLVCGHTWGAPPEDPTPGGSSVTFLHPVHEGRHVPSCEGICFNGPYGVDRDCC